MVTSIHPTGRQRLGLGPVQPENYVERPAALVIRHKLEAALASYNLSRALRSEIGWTVGDAWGEVGNSR